MRPDDAARGASSSWWCAMQLANDYSQIYQTRYNVYWVVCIPHLNGGWWMISPR